MKAERPPGEMHIDSRERDDVLLRRSANGDEEAFTLLYRRHQAPIYRFALRMTGSTWAAEEIVQDVFMTLVREPRKYDSERGALGAFLYGVARNRIMKYQERVPRDLPLMNPEDDGFANYPQAVDSATPAHWAELRERRDHVRAAVLELPARFSRGRCSLPSGRNELRGSGTVLAVPGGNDPISVASRPRPAAGKTGNVAGRAKAGQWYQVKERRRTNP